MPPVQCESCRTFTRRLGKRCINCGFKLVLLVGAMVGGMAAAHAQAPPVITKTSQLPAEPGSAALLTDYVATVSTGCPLTGGGAGNCRTTVQQILNTSGSTTYAPLTNPIFNSFLAGGVGATSNVALVSLTGNQIFIAQGVASSDSYLQAASGIAASRPAQLAVIGAPNGNNLLLGGPIGGGALAVGTQNNWPLMPFTMGAPTAEPTVSGSGAAFEVNASSQTLNIFVPGFGWHHVALANGAN